MKASFAKWTRRVQRSLRAHLPHLARHFDSFHLMEDRRLLEEVIFPYLVDDDSVRRVLFVGCDWYTKPYETYFSQKEYWTFELDPKKRRYGAKQHVTDTLCRLSNHFEPGFFDVIICNGVFMVTAIEKWDEAEASFQACHACLRRGGLFVLGWNDTPELRPYPPEESAALAHFQRFAFPPLSTHQHLTNTHYRHVYSFFTKP